MADDDLDWDELLTTLNRLRPDQVTKLAAKLEPDKDVGQHRVPHDQILTLIRGDLQRVRPQRFPSALRVFCEPFEDLLSVGDPDIRVKGRIPRAAIKPVWHWVSQVLKPPGLAAASEGLRKAAEDKDELAVQLNSINLWRSASLALGKIADGIKKDAGVRSAVIDALGHEKRLGDLDDIAAYMDIAGIIQDLKATLPERPIPELDSEHVAMVMRTINQVKESKPGREPYVVLAVMRRLAQPAEIFKVAKAMNFSLDDSIASGGLFAVAGDLVLGDITSAVKRIELTEKVADAHGEQVLLNQLHAFVDEMGGLTQTLGLSRTSRWGKQVFESRAAVGKALTRNVIATAPETILEAFPEVPEGRLAARHPGDIDVESINAAERRAHTIAECERLADQLGVNTAVRDAVGKVRVDLQAQCEQLISQLKRADEKSRMNLLPQLMSRLHIMEILLGPDTADILRRRAMSALNPAMGSDRI